MRWLILLAAASGLTAQEIQTIEITGSPGQSYALFMPSRYTAERRWPILYCLDPGARGKAAVEHFATAAEKGGFLVAGSNNSRNGPIAPSQKAIDLMVNDTHARLTIDDGRVYVAGLSGGARLALAWAGGANGAIAGVVASSAGFGGPEPPKRIPFRIFMTTGFDDFNHDELYRLSRELARRNLPHRYVEFEGGHEWLPASIADEAFGYFTGTVPPRAAEASKDAERQVADYDRLLPLVESGDRAALKQVQKDAAASEDSPARRVARRVIGGVSTGSMEGVREFMSQKQYAEAARAAETLVAVRPENANAWYSLAVAQAGAGDTKRALEALEQAVAKGFRNWERADTEPLLAKIRKDPRYQKLRKLKAAASYTGVCLPTPFATRTQASILTKPTALSPPSRSSPVRPSLAA
jgi:pimeloyl-ACP methyl ester carboxylesterase